MNKLTIISVMKNEEDILPFFLRHYEMIADQIIIFDDNSTDLTRALISEHPKCQLEAWPFKPGLVDDLMLKLSENFPRSLFGKTQWVGWVDADEFLFTPNWDNLFARADKEKWDIIMTEGWNMVGRNFPFDNGQSQIYEIHNLGIKAPVYSKPIIFRPDAKVKWMRGRHMIERCDSPISEPNLVKLLHYRYMGFEYTKYRNSKNWTNVGEDKGAAWSCDPNYTGEHSANWAMDYQNAGVSVITPEEFSAFEQWRCCYEH